MIWLETPRKRGRPSAQHRVADGTKIIGLTRHKDDGRWRISATGESFFEPDERPAVARFEAAMAKVRGEDAIELPLGSGMTPDAARQAPLDAGTSRYRAYIRRSRPVEHVAVIGSPQFYAAVREMLIDDPKDLGLKTGVEWVARGADLPKLTASPTLQGSPPPHCGQSPARAHTAAQPNAPPNASTVAPVHTHLARFFSIVFDTGPRVACDRRPAWQRLAMLAEGTGCPFNARCQVFQAGDGFPAIAATAFRT